MSRRGSMEEAKEGLGKNQIRRAITSFDPRIPVPIADVIATAICPPKPKPNVSVSSEGPAPRLSFNTRSTLACESWCESPHIPLFSKGNIFKDPAKMKFDFGAATNSRPSPLKTKPASL